VATSAAQTSSIHPTAIIAGGVELGENVSVGPYSIVEGNVRIADGVKIDSHVLVGNGSRLGKDCHLHHGAVVGTVPQDLKFEGENTEMFIGERTVVREYATINRGTKDRKKTIVGSDCLIMAYAHVAHDCWLGDHVIMGNAATLAGHVTLEDWVGISGIVPVHQFVRIGEHSYVGGGFRVPQDVVPYALMAGYPLKVMGPNRVGLERRGFTKDQIEPISRAYRIIFRSRLNTTDAIARVKAEIEQTREVKHLIEFIESSERGITG
jgi:UDP-N-acetylglucosamine acyltransferase